MRVFRSIGYVDDWSTLGLGGSYRNFFLKTAPAGAHWGMGVNIVGLQESGGAIYERDIVFLFAPKLELGYRLFLAEQISLSLRGELFYYFSSEKGNEDYPSIQGFGSIFPGKGIMTGLTLSLGFAP